MPTTSPPLLHPAEPLPPYAYVPGATPHPFRHPDGHAWQGGTAPAAAAWTLGDWRTDTVFLRGLDLLHHGFDWEAHEVWEGAWRQAPVGSPERALLQGLILLAASRLKARSDAAASQRLLARARTLLGMARDAGDVVHGVRLDALDDAVAAGVPADLRVPLAAPPGLAA